MEFAATIAFVILYFVRPQDWVPAVAGLNVIKPIMLLGFLGLATRKNRKPPWGVFNSPHDWVMVAYLIYGCYADPDWFGTFVSILPVAGFYFLTSQSVNSVARLDSFFTWWAASVVFMCVLGVATDMGLDITGARELIDSRMGRLSLNTWLMDNPNALGHTAVTAFPLVYFTMVFRRDVGFKLLAIPIFVLVGMCVLATQSKGAYLSAAAGISAALLVGRSVSVQVVLAALLVVAGSTLTSMLPRMVDRESMKHDEGVMGRALAFEAARTACETTTAGWNRFVAEIKWEGETINISTHSSLVQIGADLGTVGLFLYLSVMGCTVRSSLTLKTESAELERARRLLFSLVVGYFVSGWMINRSYHTEYFLLAGAAAAFHKLARERLGLAAGLEVHGGTEDDAEEHVRLKANQTEVGERDDQDVSQMDQPSVARRTWNRYGIVDFAIGYGLLRLTLWFWDYLINYFNVE